MSDLALIELLCQKKILTTAEAQRLLAVAQNRKCAGRYPACGIKHAGVKGDKGNGLGRIPRILTHRRAEG